ncbi:MAG: polyprenyl synthetase family protein [Pirellulales bacterium]
MSSVGSQSSLSPVEGDYTGLTRAGLPAKNASLKTAGDETVAKTDKSAKRKSSQVKLVPPTAELRERLRDVCVTSARQLRTASGLTQDALETVAKQALSDAGETDRYLGWMMVVLASEFWRDQVAAVPYARRLLLLPETLGNGACVTSLRARSERLGYRVLFAEQTSAVLQTILGGEVDAIVGTAGMDVLEKALDKILLVGVPCMAVPLLSEGDAAVIDEDRLTDMIEAQAAASASGGRTYVHLLRTASRMFEADELEKLVPRVRGRRHNDLNAAALDPIAGTEAIAFDFLTRGGKHSRPFITLAVFDALTGGRGASVDGASWTADLSPAILRTAMSIETFHKASLVHDDIEDDDQFRYGEPTLHRKYGVPTAINVGDYLIGLGYRLVSREAKTIGAETAADILDRLADAHLKLAEGQGAELLWRDSRDKHLTPDDALRIYALKTSPAFEAALFSGIRLAGPIEPYADAVSGFAKHLGTAFQILNDLKDWRGDDDNKLLAAGDVAGGRPTVLWALSLEGSTDADRARLRTLSTGHVDESVVREIRTLYERAGVFAKADALIADERRRAEEIAGGLPTPELRALFGDLIESVLAEKR